MNDKSNKRELVRKDSSSAIALQQSKKLTATTRAILAKSAGRNVVRHQNDWLKAIWAWADEFNLSDKAVPRDKVDLLQLEELSISMIPFNGEGLTYLPPEIGQLHNLQELDLSSNNLTTLPAEITQLTQLNYINLLDNPLYKLSDDVRTFLHQFEMAYGCRYFIKKEIEKEDDKQQWDNDSCIPF